MQFWVPFNVRAVLIIDPDLRTPAVSEASRNSAPTEPEVCIVEGMTKTDKVDVTTLARRLMSFDEVAAHFPGMSAAGLRKEIERGGKLGLELMPFLESFSDHRRYFRRRQFLEWFDTRTA